MGVSDISVIYIYRLIGTQNKYMLKHHWPTTTNKATQPNILELIDFGNYINYHICLSFKSIMLTILFAKLE